MWGGAYGYGTAWKWGYIKGSLKESLLFNFQHGTTVGANPTSSYLDSAGNFYVVTEGGGKYGSGTIYKFSPVAGKSYYRRDKLWSFNFTDGDTPNGVIVVGSNLYGTTLGGGANDAGVVYEITP